MDDATDEKTKEVLTRLRSYVPFLNEMIVNLRSDMPQHFKLVTLYGMITDTKRKFKYDTLKKCEDVIIKIQTKTLNKAKKKENLQQKEGSPQGSTQTTPTIRSPDTWSDIFLRSDSFGGGNTNVQPSAIELEGPGSPDPETENTPLPADRYTHERPSIYSSAAESISRPQVSSNFPTMPELDRSKPPISIADLEQLKNDVETLSCDNGAESTKTKEPKNLDIIKPQSKVSLVPAPINKIRPNRTEKSDNKSVIDLTKDDKQSPKIRKEKVVADPSTTFGNFLSNIDNDIILDSRKRRESCDKKIHTPIQTEKKKDKEKESEKEKEKEKEKERQKTQVKEKEKSLVPKIVRKPKTHDGVVDLIMKAMQYDKENPREPSPELQIISAEKSINAPRFEPPEKIIMPRTPRYSPPPLNDDQNDYTYTNRNYNYSDSRKQVYNNINVNIYPTGKNSFIPPPPQPSNEFNRFESIINDYDMTEVPPLPHINNFYPPNTPQSQNHMLMQHQPVQYGMSPSFNKISPSFNQISPSFNQISPSFEKNLQPTFEPPPMQYQQNYYQQMNNFRAPDAPTSYKSWREEKKNREIRDPRLARRDDSNRNFNRFEENNSWSLKNRFEPTSKPGFQRAKSRERFDEPRTDFQRAKSQNNLEDDNRFDRTKPRDPKFDFQRSKSTSKWFEDNDNRSNFDRAKSRERLEEPSPSTRPIDPRKFSKNRDERSFDEDDYNKRPNKRISRQNMKTNREIYSKYKKPEPQKSTETFSSPLESLYGGEKIPEPLHNFKIPKKPKEVCEAEPSNKFKDNRNKFSDEANWDEEENDRGATKKFTKRGFSNTSNWDDEEKEEIQRSLNKKVPAHKFTDEPNWDEEEQEEPRNTRGNRIPPKESSDEEEIQRPLNKKVPLNRFSNEPNWDEDEQDNFPPKMKKISSKVTNESDEEEDNRRIKKKPIRDPRNRFRDEPNWDEEDNEPVIKTKKGKGSRIRLIDEDEESPPEPKKKLKNARSKIMSDEEDEKEKLEESEEEIPAKRVTRSVHNSKIKRRASVSQTRKRQINSDEDEEEILPKRKLRARSKSMVAIRDENPEEASPPVPPPKPKEPEKEEKPEVSSTSGEETKTKTESNTKEDIMKLIENLKEKATDDPLFGVVGYLVDLIQKSKDGAKVEVPKIETVKQEAPPEVKIEVLDTSQKEIITKKKAPPGKKKGKKVFPKKKAIKAAKATESQEIVSKTVGEKTKNVKRTPARLVKKKPRRTELDKLHEHNKETFGEEILSTSSRRACTIPKEEENKSESRPDTPSSESDKVVENSKNLRVVLQKLPPRDLRKRKATESIEVENNLKKVEENEVENVKSDLIEEKRKDEIAEEAVASPAGSLDKQKTTKKKRKINTWASGVIKKRRKSMKPDESEVQNESKEDKDLDSNESKERTVVNRNYYLIPNEFNHCRLCKFFGKSIVYHYIMVHPKGEVYVSRLSPEATEEALVDAIENRYAEREEVVEEKARLKKKYNFKCRFCHQQFKNETSMAFYDHLGIHTGELRFKCALCTYRTNKIKNLRMHIGSSHPESDKNMEIIPEKPPTNSLIIYGYVCSECNFLQLNQQNVINHIQKYHKFSNVCVTKINMSLPMEQPSSLETTEWEEAKSLPEEPVKVVQPVEVNKTAFMCDENLELEKVQMEKIQPERHNEISDNLERKRSSIVETLKERLENELEKEAASTTTNVDEINIPIEIPQVKTVKKFSVTYIEANLEPKKTIVFICKKDSCIFQTTSQKVFETHCNLTHRNEVCRLFCHQCDVKESKDFTMCNIFQHLLGHILEEPVEENIPPLVAIQNDSHNIVEPSVTIKNEPESQEEEQPQLMCKIASVTSLAAPAMNNSGPQPFVEPSPIPHLDEVLKTPVTITNIIPPLVPISPIKSLVPVPTIPKNVSNITKILSSQDSENKGMNTPCRIVPMTKNECNMPRKSAEILKAWMQPDVLERLFKCPEFDCNFSTKQECEFDEHIQLHDFKEKLLPCLYCNFKMLSVYIKQHLLMRHASCTLGCPYCLYRAISSDYIQIHQEREHPTRPTKTLTFSKMVYLTKLAISLPPIKNYIKPYVCYCSKRYYVTSNFEMHIMSCPEMKQSMRCGMCKVACKKANGLVQHFRMHQVHRYNCRYCIFGGLDTKIILDHIAIEHPYHKVNIITRTLKDTSNSGKEGDDVFDKLFCLTEEGSLGMPGKNTSPKPTPPSQETSINDSGASDALAIVSDTESTFDDSLDTGLEEFPSETRTKDTPQELYICAKCKQSSSSMQMFKAHIQKCTAKPGMEKGHVCVHCENLFPKISSFLTHIRGHGKPRISCSLCAYKHTHSVYLRTHMRMKHNIHICKIDPVDPSKDDMDKDEYIARPVGLHRNIEMQITKDSPQSEPPSTIKNHFHPNEINKLPMKPIFSTDVFCSICNFGTKVRTNLVRHMQLHNNNTEMVVIPMSAPINPVPCLEKNELMFDKMTNLASSSHAGGRMSFKSDRSLKEDNELKIPQFVPDNKRYSCGAEKCNYLCLEESMFRHHLQALHDHEKSFICPHCQENLNLKTTYINVDFILKHFRLHEPNLYKCFHCEFLSNTRNKIEKHCGDKHSDKPVKVIPLREVQEDIKDKKERPWRCTICKSRRFATEIEVKEHIEVKHLLYARYKCSFCVYSSDNERSFTEHFKFNHEGSAFSLIVAYYNENEEAKTNEIKEFDTTPLWILNKESQVKHIRGILLEEHVKVSKKSPIKIGTIGNTSSSEEKKPMKRGRKKSVVKDRPSPQPPSLAPVTPVPTLNDNILSPPSLSPVFPQKIQQTTTSAPTSVPFIQALTSQPVDITSIKVEPVEDDDISLEISEVENCDIDADDSTFREDVLKKNYKQLINGDYMGEYGPYGIPKDDKFLCPVCECYETKKSKLLETHLNKELANNKFACSICNSSSTDYANLRKHLQTVHSKSADGLITNLETNPSIDKWIKRVLFFQERIISLSSTQAEEQKEGENVKKIKTEDSGEVSFKFCGYCSYKTKIKSDLKHHELRHFGLRPYKCFYCDRTAIKRCEIITHIKQFHQGCEVRVDEIPIPDLSKLTPVALKGGKLNKLEILSDNSLTSEKLVPKKATARKSTNFRNNPMKKTARKSTGTHPLVSSCAVSYYGKKPDLTDEEQTRIITTVPILNNYMTMNVTQLSKFFDLFPTVSVEDCGNNIL